MSEQCQWCLYIVRMAQYQQTNTYTYIDTDCIVSCLCRYEHHKTAVYSQSIGWFTHAQWQVAWPLQLHCTVSVGLIRFIVCLHIHLPVLVDNLYGRQWVRAVNHMSTSYMEHFRAYMELGNQSVTKMRGKWYIDRYIPLFHVQSHWCEAHSGLTQILHFGIQWW